METPKTLYEIYDLVERIARSVPNVNTFTETFESLNAEDTEYSAVVLQFRDGTQPSDGFVRYRFYLGYADRVNDQGSDKIKIQSVAEQALRTIINKVNQDVEIEYGTFTPFEQRFTALTTGGYVECSCTLAVSDCNYETGSVLRNGKVTITENGTTTVVPSAGVDGFKQVEVTTDVQPILEVKKVELPQNGTYTWSPSEGYDGLSKVTAVVTAGKDFYDLAGTKYRGSTISKFPDNMNFSARTYDTCSDMFWGCTRLTTVPLFDTSKATSMQNMFRGCLSLAAVPLFDTSSVKNMQNMFRAEYNGVVNSKLTTVPLFDTRSVTNMSGMFSSCVSLTEVPLFDTSSVTDMNNMFDYCIRLTEVPLFDTSSVTNMSSMFSRCNNLNKVPDFDTSSVTDIAAMFSQSTLSSTPSFDMSSVTDTHRMFYGSFIKTIGNLFKVMPTSNSVTATGMFESCSVLQTGSDDLGEFLSHCKNINYMFQDCKNLKSATVTTIGDWTLSPNCTSIAGLFYDCTQLLQCPCIDMTYVTFIYKMFYGCSSLQLLYKGGLKNLKCDCDLSPCTALTHDSLVDLFNVIATVSGNTTLTLGETNLAKLTDEEKAIATGKGWTLK